jgi:hypothetical protein
MWFCSVVGIDVTPEFVLPVSWCGVSENKGTGNQGDFGRTFTKESLAKKNQYQLIKTKDDGAMPSLRAELLSKCTRLSAIEGRIDSIPSLEEAETENDEAHSALEALPRPTEEGTEEEQEEESHFAEL